MTGRTVATLALTAVGLPPVLNEIVVAGAMSVFERLRKERLDRAHLILANQIAKGKTWKLSDDENASAIFTYFRASQDGAAQVNLEAMAEAIVTENQEPVLTSYTRRRHLMNLASLSYEEVLVLAAFIKAKMTFEAQPIVADQKFFPWPEVVKTLTSNRSIFEDTDDIFAICSALQRTGYIRPANVYSGTAFGMTKQLSQLSRMVDLEAAQRRADGS